MLYERKGIVACKEWRYPDDVLITGYQPQAPAEPFVKKPPKGGSSVMPPPQASNGSTKPKKQK